MTKIIYGGREYHFSLAKVPINRQGYDRYGSYYGIGAPVYRASEEIGVVEEFRASSREQAIEKLKELVRQGKFD